MTRAPTPTEMSTKRTCDVLQVINIGAKHTGMVMQIFCASNVKISCIRQLAVGVLINNQSGSFVFIKISVFFHRI